MPLERFIPKSPDPFIRNSQDFEVAKFGHLNTIIEYVNTYVAADSLQLAGTGPLTSTARYITDSLGNTSTLAISTVNIGIGTSTPTSLLDVVRYTTGSVDNAYQFRILNSADGLYPYSVLLLEHNNRTGIGNQGGASIIIKDGFANVSRASIGFDYFNSGSYSSAGGNLRLSNDGQGNLLLSTAGVDALRIFKDQGVQIGGVSTNLSSIARLLVKGSGSTSATTSLLVQNSAATQILKVQDDGQVFVNQGNQQITFAGAGGISRIQAPNEMTIGLGASFNAMKVYYDGRVGLQNDAVYISSGNVGIGTTAPAAKLTIDTGDLLFTTPGNSQIYGLRNGVNQDTRIIINNQSTGGLHLGAKYGNPSGCIYFECGLGAYTERMRLTPNGNLLIGTTSDTARLNIVGSGSTSATTSLLVQNSGGTTAFQVKDNLQVDFGGIVRLTNGDVYVNLTSPSSDAFATGVFGSLNFYVRADGRTKGNRILAEDINGMGTLDNSAILQANSTTRGFLPPRMTTAQRTAIVSPAAGLMVYDTDTNKSYTYDGTAWQAHW